MEFRIENAHVTGCGVVWGLLLVAGIVALILVSEEIGGGVLTAALVFFFAWSVVEFVYCLHTVTRRKS